MNTSEKAQVAGMLNDKLNSVKISVVKVWQPNISNVPYSASRRARQWLALGHRQQYGLGFI